MRLLAPGSLLVATAAAVAVDSRQADGSATSSAASSLLAQVADTWVRRGVTKDFDYTTSVLYRGLEFAIAQTDNQTILDFYESQMSIVEDDGTITDFNYTFYSLDEYRFGMSTLYWYNQTGEEKYKLAADKIRDMLNRHPRNAEGGFWHRAPTYPNQMWLDGIFMADSFYAAYTSLFEPDNTTAWDDIALQFDLLEEHCNNATSGLLKHGYDASKVAVWADPVTGASPLVWDRADGWFFVSLLEAIQVWPESHAGRAKLIGYFESLAAGLLKAQDASGGWWLVMDEQYAGAPGNYIESSATAMFTFGFLKGIKLGLLDSATYLAPAQKAYDMMVDNFVVVLDDGTIDWEGTVLVGSLNSNGTYEYYISIATNTNDFKGVGPFMYASYEIENL